MTRPLSDASPRRAAAREFGVLLGRTMVKRGVGQRRVAAAAGVATSAVSEWRVGNNLPTLRTAIRVATALDEPKLAAIVRSAREGTCAAPSCNRTFLNEGGKPKLYCSPDCRDMAATRRKADAPTPGQDERALQLLRGELLRVGPVRKQVVGRALTLLEDDFERSPGLVARRRLPVLMAAIDAMCRSCEPDGYCRDAECPLRTGSPFPVLEDDTEVVAATKPPGRWGQPGAGERHSAAMREQWKDPDRRARHQQMLEERYRDPERRQRHVDAMVAGRRGAVAP